MKKQRKYGGTARLKHPLTKRQVEQRIVAQLLRFRRDNPWLDAAPLVGWAELSTAINGFAVRYPKDCWRVLESE